VLLLQGGGFSIGGFSSRVGRDMLVKVDHCVFANNTPQTDRRVSRGAAAYDDEASGNHWPLKPCSMH